MDQKTETVLVKNLKLNQDQVNRLENDPETLSTMLGLIQIIRQSAKNNDTRLFAISRLKELRRALIKPEFEADPLMLKARSEYYTFH